VTSKLWTLNIVLLMLIGLVSWRIRTHWLEADARERRILDRQAVAPEVPPLRAATQGQPLLPSAYADVAAKMLFSRDRNPTVVIEVEQAKPMPALPLAFGVVILGGEPLAILSERGGAPQKMYGRGETIGEFTVAAVTQQSITFDWNGQQVTRPMNELMQQARAATDAGAPAAGERTAAPVNGGAQAVAVSTEPKGPGTEMGTANLRACQPGDSSPPGTIRDGFRKVVSDSPFGKVCRWVPAQ
jgi:hypothetical protein